MTVKNLLLCAAALLIGASLMARSPESVEFEYPDAHDPVAAFCDGRYYVFTTGMGIMSSDDLTHWRFEGRVLTNFERKGLQAGRVIHDFAYRAV